MLDIIGAVLVASEVVRRYKGKQYKENTTWIDIAEQAKSEEYIKHETENYRRMSFGLVFLIVGFLLQLASQWTPIIYFPSSPASAQQITAKPYIKCTDCHNQIITVEDTKCNKNTSGQGNPNTIQNNNERSPDKHPII